jgi:hypothetical protein
VAAKRTARKNERLQKEREAALVAEASQVALVKAKAAHGTKLIAEWVQDFQRHLSIFRVAVQNTQVEQKATLGAIHDFLEILQARAPKLLDRALPFPLWNLFCFSDRWVRHYETWEPAGKGKESQYRSLIKHLFCKYPLPAFLYRVFMQGDQRLPAGKDISDLELFAALGSGASLYKLVQSGEVRVPLTRKMCHLFLQAPEDFDIVPAFRRAQILGLGGENRLVRAIRISKLGEAVYTKDEEIFWETVLQWLVNNPMLDMAQVSPLIDYFQFKFQDEKAKNLAYSIKGRTPVSVMRDMTGWHAHLGKTKDIKGDIYKPSGFKAGSWPAVMMNDSRKMLVTMQEILTGTALAAEGRAQSHCVYSYGSSCLAGTISIWSLGQQFAPEDIPVGERKRLVTIEVGRQARQIRQVRGKCNRRPTPNERNWIKRWANENLLTIGPGVF